MGENEVGTPSLEEIRQRFVRWQETRNDQLTAIEIRDRIQSQLLAVRRSRGFRGFIGTSTRGKLTTTLTTKGMDSGGQ